MRAAMTFHKALLLVAVAAVAWLVAGVYYEASLLDLPMVGLLLIGAGFALSAWALPGRRGVAAAGFGVALVGIVLFLDDGLGSFRNLARVGSHLFAAGLVLMGLGAWLASPARVPVFRAGAALALLAVVAWLVADADGGGAWQPGNVLAGVGVAWAMARPPVEPLA